MIENEEKNYELEEKNRALNNGNFIEIRIKYLRLRSSKI